jgi:predicted nicotinamide N-methyase
MTHTDLVFGLHGGSKAASLTIRETGGYGGRVWASALLLSQELLNTPSIVEGKRVLELGAGCGATGLTAAACGANEVVLTDGEQDVLANLSLNVERNRGSLPPRAAVSTHLLDWVDDQMSADRFDILLGADIVYIPSSLSYLASTIRRRMKRDGRFLGISPAGRNSFLVFWHYLQCEGLSVCTKEIKGYQKVLKAAAESKRVAALKREGERRKHQKRPDGGADDGEKNVFDMFAGFTYVSEESEDEEEASLAEERAQEKAADEVEFVMFEVTFADERRLFSVVGSAIASVSSWPKAAMVVFVIAGALAAAHRAGAAAGTTAMR